MSRSQAADLKCSNITTALFDVSHNGAVYSVGSRAESSRHLSTYPHLIFLNQTMTVAALEFLGVWESNR